MTKLLPAITALVVAAYVVGAPLSTQQLTQQDPAKRAHDLLAQMTLDEKITMVHGVQGGYVGNIAGNSRLGIPPLTMNDGPQGFRADTNHSGTSTAFPCGLAIAATFNPASAYTWGATMGEEFVGKGSNVQLGPGLCVARIPQNGRNFEYLSGEDPFLGSLMVKPAINGIQSTGVIANAKHYINNNEETDRTNVSEVVDERTEFEIYLPPFHAAIEADVGSVMCSYNRINGVHACENNVTLNADLKSRMGFQGWVMSDWGATHSTMLAANAGLDQQMPDDSFFGANLKAAVSNGTVSEATLDDKVYRILFNMFKFGLFDHGPTGDLDKNVTSEAHNQVARDLAAKSMVLVKNEGILPLDVEKPPRRLVVVGDAGADGVIAAGDGSGHVVPPYVISPLQGLSLRAASYGGSVDYIPTPAGGKFSKDEQQKIQDADAVVVCTATTSGEGHDRKNLSLPDPEIAMTQAALEMSKSTIVAVTTPGAVLMPWADAANAIVVMFMPGQELGNALTDLLFNSVDDHSARLPLTMPNSENDQQFTPAQYPGLPVDNPLVAEYSEQRFVGYRWYTHHKVDPRFCFGHGLSYTEFALSDISVTGRTVEVTVTNKGAVPATAVLQMYIDFHLDDEPPVQLKGIQRFTGMNPDAGAKMSFTLSDKDLSLWDMDSHDWKLTAEPVTAYVGFSSCDLPLSASVNP